MLSIMFSFKGNTLEIENEVLRAYRQVVERLTLMEGGNIKKALTRRPRNTQILSLGYNYLLLCKKKKPSENQVQENNKYFIILTHFVRNLARALGGWLAYAWGISGDC